MQLTAFFKKSPIQMFKTFLILCLTNVLVCFPSPTTLPNSSKRSPLSAPTSYLSALSFHCSVFWSPGVLPLSFSRLYCNITLLYQGHPLCLVFSLLYPSVPSGGVSSSSPFIIHLIGNFLLNFLLSFKNGGSVRTRVILILYSTVVDPGAYLMVSW